MSDLQYLALSGLLTWLMVIAAAELSHRTWTWEGIKSGLSNREKPPERSPLAARADRAARNMLENLPVFTALLAAAHLSDGDPGRLQLGAAIFFWSRLAFWLVYLAGIPIVRTLIWGISLIGMGMIGSTLF